MNQPASPLGAKQLLEAPMILEGREQRVAMEPDTVGLALVECVAEVLHCGIEISGRDENRGEPVGLALLSHPRERTSAVMTSA